MKAYEDPNHPGNGPSHHTGKSCIHPGCKKPAGTAWGPWWCPEHNAERINRIDGQLERISQRLEEKA